MPGFEARSWHGVFVPTATPLEIVARLNSEIVKILRIPEAKKGLNAQGVKLVGNSPKEYAASVRKERHKWAKAVIASGARAE